MPIWERAAASTKTFLGSRALRVQDLGFKNFRMLCLISGFHGSSVKDPGLEFSI